MRMYFCLNVTIVTIIEHEYVWSKMQQPSLEFDEIFFSNFFLLKLGGRGDP